MNCIIFLAAAAAFALPFFPASAQNADIATTGWGNPDAVRGTVTQQPSEKGSPQTGANSNVITGRHLDIARDAITPSLGAGQYTFDR